MNKAIVVTGLVLAIASASAGILFQQIKPTDDSTLSSVNNAELTTLPNESFPDLSGTSHSLQEWSGKVVVLNFWATWCPPCRKEIPLFIDLQAKLGDKGLQFVGIAVDKTEDVRDYAEKNRINYPILIGSDNAIKLARQLGNHFDGLPFSIIFDRQGQATYLQAGELKEATLRKEASKHL